MRGCEWLSNVNMEILGITLYLTLITNAWCVDICYHTLVVQAVSHVYPPC